MGMGKGNPKGPFHIKILLIETYCIGMRIQIPFIGLLNHERNASLDYLKISVFGYMRDVNCKLKLTFK